jgi:transketolase
MNNSINNIRTLSVDMVEKAKSGHPGAPLGLAPFIHTLYKHYLRINPDDDRHPCRDIFILSNGHACALQYVMNYLIGYLTLDDLKQFRQLNGLTPGHPERKTKGIESTTGPLGQGVSNSVGYAISLLKLNQDSHVYCVFGDGCYMEGISQESFSIASNLNLSNITFVYDFNKITIDGPTSLSMNEDVEMRFRSLNFTVLVVDGEDIKGIQKALDVKSDRPKVLILHTLIGRDSVLEGNNKAHGSPIGEEGVRKLKEKYGIPLEEFYVSDSLLKEWTDIKEEKRKLFRKDKEEKKEINIENVDDIFEDTEIDKSKLATRKLFSIALNTLKKRENILCGSADLAGSCLNRFNNSEDFNSNNREGNFINFGIREHAMCGIMNGISGHGFFLPMFSTFLNFITYGFPSVRLGALDMLNNVYVLTHDSICLGEDGPTHQPIEVLTTLRATPNLIVIRPCDIKECRGALRVCIRIEGPKAVILSRQKVPYIEESDEFECMKGAYYLIKEDRPDLVLFGTGSEIEICINVSKRWTDKKISVVSFFSWELFEMQNEEYKKSILLEGVPKISIEALCTLGWQKYSDYQIGVDRFGWSGKCNEVYEEAGFTTEKVIEKIKKFLE